MFEEAEALADEQREFLRLDYEAELDFKVLKGDKLSKKSEVYSRNMSACGLLFRTAVDSSIPAISSIVWVGLDPKMMNICTEIEEDLIEYNNGVYGRVVRIAEGEHGKSYDIGICFLRKKDLRPEEIQALMVDSGQWKH